MRNALIVGIDHQEKLAFLSSCVEDAQIQTRGRE
jgi:hypothetical protein